VEREAAQIFLHREYPNQKKFMGWDIPYAEKFMGWDIP
jgi:hypothetical protein